MRSSGCPKYIVTLIASSARILNKENVRANMREVGGCRNVLPFSESPEDGIEYSFELNAI